jgi:hypothetical protein
VLDEKGLRRPECDERTSVAVRLADGNDWLLPKPFVEIHASFRGGKAEATFPVLTYGPELDALIEAVGECRDNAAILCGAATLGAYLVTRNYDLDDSQLDMLFAFRPGDPGSWDWINAVMDVATGVGGSRSFRGGNG